MKNIRLLFQGDSITDVGRDKRNFYDLGPGYPKFVAEALRSQYPDTTFEFINLGISGNRTDQLFDRLYPDAIALEPDVISILIGINDIWHRCPPNCVMTTDEQIELNYREILKNIKKHTNAKILILEPYLLDSESVSEVKKDIGSLLTIVRKLADEYADAYVPLQDLFAAVLENQPAPQYYSADGVHPNENGAKFIAEHYVNAINKILN